MTFVDPSSAFNLSYARQQHRHADDRWHAQLGRAPLIGAVLLGTVQQVATVTISSEINLLIVGGLLVIFIIAAPNGIAGMAWGRKGRRP